MEIKLKAETPQNRLFLKYVYDCIKAGYEVKIGGVEDYQEILNLEGRQHLSTVINWGGKRLFFDLSDHAFLWNVDALEKCDVYFKANLHRGIAKKFLPSELWERCSAKVYPFLLFAPEIELLSKANALFRIGVWHRPLDVTQIVGVYRNHALHSGETLNTRAIPEDCSPDEYHFWIRFLTHKFLGSSGLKVCSKLTSKGQKEQEDHITIHPSVNKYMFFRKLAASRYQFVNVMPHALFPWKMTEGLAFGTPTIVDHNPLMEMPRHFTMEEGTHYLSLLGNQFDFDLGVDPENPAAYRLLDPLNQESLELAFERLFARIEDRDSYQTLLHNLNDFRKSKLTAENICRIVTEPLE